MEVSWEPAIANHPRKVYIHTKLNYKTLRACSTSIICFILHFISLCLKGSRRFHKWFSVSLTKHTQLCSKIWSRSSLGKQEGLNKPQEAFSFGSIFSLGSPHCDFCCHCLEHSSGRLFCFKTSGPAETCTPYCVPSTVKMCVNVRKEKKHKYNLIEYQIIQERPQLPIGSPASELMF